MRAEDFAAVLLWWLTLAARAFLYCLVGLAVSVAVFWLLYTLYELYAWVQRKRGKRW